MKINIKKTANKKGLSLYKLAKKMKVNLQTLCSWANGRTQPNYKNMDKLCNTLDCNLNELFECEKPEREVSNA